MSGCGCYYSRYQFLSRMPPITRAQLVNQMDLTVDELAALADRIMLSQASVQSLMAEGPWLLWSRALPLGTHRAGGPP